MRAEGGTQNCSRQGGNRKERERAIKIKASDHATKDQGQRRPSGTDVNNKNRVSEVSISFPHETTMLLALLQGKLDHGRHVLCLSSVKIYKYVAQPAQRVCMRNI